MFSKDYVGEGGVRGRGAGMDGVSEGGNRGDVELTKLCFVATWILVILSFQFSSPHCKTKL